MKNVLITGGTKGLGKKLVQKYLDEGYNVFATYHNKEYEKIDNVTYLELDLDNNNSIDNLINNISNIDILINNAGISIDDDILNKTYDNIRKVISTNLIGPLYLSSKIINKMNNGVIIFVSSDCAFNNNYPEGIDYDASKIGLTKVVEDLAIYLAPNIRVIGVAPGWIDTPMNSNLDETYKQEQIDKILLNRFAKAEEIANTIYNISQDTYINGTTIVVNGGTK